MIVPKVYGAEETELWKPAGHLSFPDLKLSLQREFSLQ